MSEKKVDKLIEVGHLLAKKYATKDSSYGGKGKFALPKSHVAAIQVPKGGSCCQNCKYVDSKNHACKNKFYIEWNKSAKLPKLALDEICSDWYEPKAGALK